MERKKQRIIRLAGKAKTVLKEDPKGFALRGVKYTYYHTFPHRRPRHIHYKDILFIDGTNIDFLVRYRIGHLMEQLAANGVTSDSIYVGELTLDLVKRYRGFVFYRNIPNDTVREFLKLAKYYNKACFFSIDDLVIDTEYTSQLEAVKGMSKDQRELYDGGVKGYGDMMRLCDYSITTTEPLAAEMQRKGAGVVHINRNVMSQDMIAFSDKAIKEVVRDSTKVVLGYFSGSSTHDVDFQMVLPALRKIMKKYSHVYIKLVGRITPPEGLEDYSDRLIYTSFMDWKVLPAAIRSCDINLSPLAEDNVFNRSKSENKWSEASLVKTVTLASNIGAFKSEIRDGVTGVLADNDSWFEKLSYLIENPDVRKKIAEASYDEVRTHRTTIDEGGRALTKFIKSKLATNVKFIIPSIDISGGINVIFKHAEILREAGYDVGLLSLDPASDLDRLELLNRQHDVAIEKDVNLEQGIDKIVATHWSTFQYMKKYPNALKQYYLVQGYESLIYAPGLDARIKANATYSDRSGVQFLTISSWCKAWLRENFEQEAKYAPNGLDLSLFTPTERNYDEKIKILVEGNHKDPLKNVDEAFEIINHLDEEKFRISYLSYASQPKERYRVNETYNRIPPQEVGKVYKDHHILLKTSLLESFSYPPLEMMATGGQVVAIKNEGNAEYISDDNAVIIKKNQTKVAAEAINRLVADGTLQKRLSQNGLKTASQYDWGSLKKQIISLYE